LTSIPPQTIRRWVAGHRYKYKGKQRRSAPVLRSDFERLDNRLAISFADLVEVRFVYAFRAAGVGWKSVRAAYEKAAEIFDRPHPFNLNKFRTDGRTVFAEILSEDSDEPALLDLVRSQHVFRKVIEPYLKGLEFSDDGVVQRWWPLEQRKTVVLDPGRAFGQPIVNKFGVPTEVLAASFQSEQSRSRVAKLFEVTETSVRDAVEFEHCLAA